MLVQNFDFNPFVSEVKTASFTVAADEYAIVKVNADDGGVFSVDGTPFIDKSVNNHSSVGSFTVSAGYTFYGQASAAQAAVTDKAVITLDGNSVVDVQIAGGGAQLSVSVAVKARSGQVFARDVGVTTGITGLTGYEVKNGARYAEVILKAGTVVTISGTVRCLVQRYKVIS